MADFSFKYNRAEDDTVDSEYVLLVDGVPARISIQDARSYGGGYGVNEYGGEGAGLWMRIVGECSTLKAAKAKAISHYKSTVMANG